MNLNQNQEPQNQAARLRHDDTLSADWDTVPEQISERVSEEEMREVMALYDTQIGIHPARHETAQTAREQANGTGAGLPTIADVAEILGIQTTEAQRLLHEVRTSRAAEAAAQMPPRRVPPPPQTHMPPLNVTPPAAPYVGYGTRTTVQQVQPGQRMNVAPGQQVSVAPGQQVTFVQQVVVDSHAHLFDRFNQNGGAYVSTWNWGPFLWGPLWYFYKGMWLKGLLYWILGIFASLITGGASLILLPIAMGFMGNYDYYLYRCHGTQGWDRKPVGYLPTTTYITNAAQTDPRYASGSFQQQPRQMPPPPPMPQQPQQQRVEETTPSPATKFQLLREGYERGLFTRTEYEEKRLILLRELENQDNLRKLDDALRMGLITAAEYEQKRDSILNGRM